MSNENCTVRDSISGRYNASQTLSSMKHTTTRQQVDTKMIQNVVLICVDTNIDNNNEDYCNMMTQVRSIVNTVSTFTDLDHCIDFLTDINDKNVFMIISDVSYQNIVPVIHDSTQLHSIFIYDKIQIKDEQWIKQWPKIKSISNEFSQICVAFKQSLQQYEQNFLSISFVPIDDNISSKNFNRLDPAFMYTQIIKEILLSIKFEQHHIIEFIEYCHHVFDDNENELKNVDQLKEKYYNQTPIWWYTHTSFLYLMLNRALRLTDINIIIKMAFFICDLHRHIEKLHKEQFNNHHTNKSFIVYRGQGLSQIDFDRLMNTMGGLMSFNNFLSTSKDRAVSQAFAESNQINSDLVGILFVITIDPMKSSTPFASINDVSHFQTEDEVLFSMHTVFRIDDVQLISENHRLFQVNLTLTSDNDKDLCKLTNSIREEIPSYVQGWERLAVVLLKMGQSDKAQEIYQILFDQTTNTSERASIYNQLGFVKYNQGEYQEARVLCEKGLEMSKNSLRTNHSDLASSYNNIAEGYRTSGEYSKAFSYYEKALEIQKESLPSNHLDLAMSYNNIGNLYYNTGEYSKALSYYEKALEIQKESLPSTHPDLAMSYNNIGAACQNIGDYLKALSYSRKALEIQKQSLLPNHPDLAMSYYNIGNLYYNTGQYSEALSYYQKTLEIQQQSLPSNYPDLAKCYNNIGAVYYKMGEYENALVFYKKALEIDQKTLSADHPDLTRDYNNISLVCRTMSGYQNCQIT